MYIVAQVCGPTQTIYEGTKREFGDYHEALHFMMDSFKSMYGDECVADYEFWDPELKELSTSIHTVEMFAPNEEDGWFMFRDWSNVH